MYARGTVVTIEDSKRELDALLRKHAATQRGILEDDARGVAMVCFAMQGGAASQQYRIEVPLPKLEQFKRRPSQPRTWDQRRAHEQACRERWRAVVLAVKAKLELIAIGVSTPEREFLADLVLSTGETVHALFERHGRHAALDGAQPQFLLGSGKPGEA